MNLHIIPLILLIGYTVLTIGIANIVLRKKLGSDHFLVAGRALPLALVVAVVLGDWIGGNATVGVSQRGYTEGILGSSYSIALGLAMFVFASTMSARFRRLKAITIPEVVGRLFDRKTRLMAAIVIGVAYFIAGITQIIAGGALLAPLLGVDKWIADLAATVIFMAIITAGGLRSIAVVNIIQMGIIFIGIVVSLVYSLSMIGGSVAGGVSRLWTDLPPSFWSLTSRHPLTLAGEVVATVLTCFAGQAAITGIFAAKDTKAAVQGAWIVGVLLMPIGIAFAMLGMCARIHFGNELPYGLSAAPAMMLALNPFIAGIAMCGLFAAIVSTGPLCFLAPTQIIVRDIYSVYIKPDANDRAKLLLSRTLAVGLLILGGIFAVKLTRVLEITYLGFAFRVGIAVILLSVTFIGSRRISEDGAFYGLIAGVIAFGLWNYVLDSPYSLHVGIPTALTVFVATVLISRFRNRRQELTPEVREAMYPEKGGA